jgi:ribosomal-protein-alanine N-acetyltransferase
MLLWVMMNKAGRLGVMTHKGTVPLLSERLLLRRFSQNDADAMFHHLFCNAEAMRYLPWETHTTVATTEAHLSGYVNAYDNNEFYAWAITLKDSCTPIGFIDTTIDKSINAVKVDYGIGKAWWHKGYTAEALSVIIEFFFTEVGVNRVYATHDPRNPNSGRVMLKCGMKYEGTLQQTRYRKNEYSDRAMYAILAEDYVKPDL